MINTLQASKPCSNHVCQTLRRLTVFEDCSKVALQRRFDVLEELIRNQTENASVNKALAKASLRLEQVFAASFLIDAKDFFQAYQPDWIWPWRPAADGILPRIEIILNMLTICFMLQVSLRGICQSFGL